MLLWNRSVVLMKSWITKADIRKLKNDFIQFMKNINKLETQTCESSTMIITLLNHPRFDTDTHVFLKIYSLHEIIFPLADVFESQLFVWFWLNKIRFHFCTKARPSCWKPWVTLFPGSCCSDSFHCYSGYFRSQFSSVVIVHYHQQWRRKRQRVSSKKCSRPYSFTKTSHRDFRFLWDDYNLE